MESKMTIKIFSKWRFGRHCDPKDSYGVLFYGQSQFVQIHPGRRVAVPHDPPDIHLGRTILDSWLYIEDISKHLYIFSSHTLTRRDWDLLLKRDSPRHKDQSFSISTAGGGGGLMRRYSNPAITNYNDQGCSISTVCVCVGGGGVVVCPMLEPSYY